MRDALASDSIHTWVAVEGHHLAGFVGARIVDERRLLGEIYIVGVAPEAQRRGVGTALTEHAEHWLAEHGMHIVYINTGGDASHAPARQLYEQLGYRLFPSAQYFKVLQREP